MKIIAALSCMLTLLIALPAASAAPPGPQEKMCLPGNTTCAEGGGSYNCIGGQKKHQEWHTPTSDSYDDYEFCAIYEQDGKVCFWYIHDHFKTVGHYPDGDQTTENDTENANLCQQVV